MTMVLLFMLFMTPMVLMNGMFWFTQLYLFLGCLIFLLFVNMGDCMSSLSYFMGVDMLSFFLIMLSFWIVSLMLVASYSIFDKNYYSNFFSFTLLFLMIFLFLTFSSLNLMYFYLFFEASLLPTLFLILGWGYQPERLQAGLYLLFYTLFGSLPLLIGILYYYSSFNSLVFFYMSSEVLNVIFFFAMIFAFLIKIPMYFFHLWLPKAHVEAPVSGSMILAGIMLKLGGYGILRVLPILVSSCMQLSYLLIVVSLYGSFLVGFICIRQVDIKMLIAYSSVSHMGLVLCGILISNSWGYSGGLILMIAHGLCSSGLFCLANITYERFHSRSMYINKGLIVFMPTLSMWWFMFCAGNMAAPPTLNLLGEIFLFNSVLSWSYLSMIFLMFISFFSAVYSLYLYSYTQHGKNFLGLFSFSYISIREYLLLFLHLLPLNIFILKTDMFTVWF